MMKLTMAALAVATLAAPVAFAPSEAAAQDRTITMGFSGLMDRRNRTTLPPLTLGSGKPVSEAPIELFSGGYYQIDIVADGSAEMGLNGPDFFRAIWVNEVVINEIEVRPLGLDSFEFDDEGTITLSFIAIKPGKYALQVPGTTGDTQRVEITIR